VLALARVNSNVGRQNKVSPGRFQMC
jgi:hypothetical protein